MILVILHVTPNILLNHNKNKTNFKWKIACKLPLPVKIWCFLSIFIINVENLHFIELKKGILN